MIPLICAILIFVISGGALADTTRVMGGGVSGVWTRAHSPYMVEGNLVISDDATLRIESGVKVLFTGPYSMTVYGTLVVGKKGGKLFGGDKGEKLTTVFTTDTVTNPEGWRGLRFNEAKDCALANLEISEARATGAGEEGIGGAIYSHDTKLAVANCLLERNRAEIGGGGIAVIGGSVALANFEISGNYGGVRGGAIFADKGAELALANGNIKGNYGGGIACVGGSELAFANGSILDNTGFGLFAEESEINIVNADISGNTEGGIVLRNRSEASLVNCSLRGPNALDREEGCETAKINVSIKD